jgi:hypothetical protein
MFAVAQKGHVGATLAAFAAIVMAKGFVNDQGSTYSGM